MIWLAAPRQNAHATVDAPCHVAAPSSRALLACAAVTLFGWTELTQSALWMAAEVCKAAQEANLEHSLGSCSWEIVLQPMPLASCELGNGRGAMTPLHQMASISQPALMSLSTAWLCLTMPKWVISF